MIDRMDVLARDSKSKLVDVLKRTGLAASMFDANQMAQDISKTEGKVQEYFNKKKVELDKDLDNRKGLKQEEKNDQEVILNKEVEIRTPSSTTILESTCKECDNFALKKNDDGNPAQLDEPSTDLSTAREKEEAADTLKNVLDEEQGEVGQEFIYAYINGPAESLYLQPQKNLSNFFEQKNEEVLEEPLTTRILEETKDEEPTQEVQESRLEVIEEIPMEPEETSFNEQSTTLEEEKQPVDTSEEEKVDLTTMFNYSNQEQTQNNTQRIVEQQKPEQPENAAGIKTNSDLNHPKTGTSEEIDIMEMFNFAKKGKL
ncbi:hypothetical protein GOV05_03790 [Candidatus Woesearchaeota archaeon]|nr:hypothetical protein [Candidatus Woesearchaeota archaeon]